MKILGMGQTDGQTAGMQHFIALIQVYFGR